jgi:membrane protein insertase Oxa1/YidC/SpoIIIJ
MHEEFGRAMTMQMRYILPVIIGVISYTSGAIALYFIISNIFMLIQTILAHFSTKSLRLSQTK